MRFAFSDWKKNYQLKIWKVRNIVAGEYDDKFEEITGILQKMQKSVGGLDELRMEVRDIRNELRDTNSNVKILNQKVDGLSSQFNDVGVMAIKDHTRVDNLETRVDALEAEVH